MAENKCSNVAIGKPAFQSSTSPWSTEDGAAGVLKKECLKDFGFHTSNEQDPWWYVDLLWEYPIDRIVIYNRPGFAERARTLKVEVSLNFIDWQVVHTGLVFINQRKDDIPLVLPLSGMVRARYVKLSLTEKQYFHLKKIEVLVNDADIYAAENINDAQQPLFFSIPQKTMKIGIIGTSNSIMQGYTTSLCKNGFNISSNLSVGSSHSMIVPFRLKCLEEVDIDILVLDFMVNEQFAINNNFPVWKKSLEILDYVRFWCLKKRIIPVLLMMPNMTYYTSRPEVRLKMDEARYGIREYCILNKVPFFDGHDFIQRIAESWARSEKSLFKDASHLNMMAAKLLGSAFARSMHSALSNDNEQLNFGHSEISVSQYDPILVPKNSSLPIIERRTTLLSQKFIKMKMNDCFTLDVPEKAQVVGIAFNLSQTNSALQIDGVTHVIKRLDNFVYNPERSIWLAVWTLATPIDTNGTVSIKCIGTKDIDKFEDNDHRNPNFIAPDDVEFVAEIAGIVVKSPPERARAIEIQGVEVDLINNIDIKYFLNSGKQN